MSAKTITNPPTPSRFSLQRIFQAARQEATGSKTSAYIATTILTGVIFALISLLIIIILSPQNVVATLLVLSFIFALSFSPIRYALEELIRQLFPSTDYNSHELIKRLNVISYSTLSRQELAHQFFKDLRAGINSGGIAFIFFESKNHLIKTNELFTHFKNTTEQEINQLQSVAKMHTTVITRCPDSNTKKICHEYQINLMVPLTVNDQLTGILVLGPKLDHKSYTTKDIKVLNAIAPKIGYAIQNAISYEKVAHKNSELIHELKEANEQLRKANRQLRRDDKLKDEFVYIATHELKNPVTAIKGYLALINEGSYGNLPSKLKPPVEQITQSTQQLISLLNNLLQIARTEAERIEIKTQPVTICKVIDQVLDDLKSFSAQKSIQITHSCPNPNVAVMADRDRLQEIINNLVTNAVKYSDKGTIDISHQIVQDHLVTHIKDEGVGITKEDQGKIFTRFFRVEEEAAKGIPGSGLGLFLVKQLIEKMNGSITFKSKIGVGSTFSISLPLARSYALKSN